MLPYGTLTISHQKTGATSNLYITNPSRKRSERPAASDNVQNHTQVTEVVELASLPLRYICKFLLGARGLHKLNLSK
jgi:hypothetical protein